MKLNIDIYRPLLPPPCIDINNPYLIITFIYMKFATENTFWDKYDTDRISVDMKRKCQSTLSVKLNIFPFYHVCCLGAQPLVRAGGCGDWDVTCSEDHSPFLTLNKMVLLPNYNLDWFQWTCPHLSAPHLKGNQQLKRERIKQWFG